MSHISNLEAGQTIQELRLVPHDNNVGQRNVQLIPGGDAAQDLVDFLEVSSGRQVKKVCVKKVTVDIELENDSDGDYSLTGAMECGQTISRSWSSRRTLSDRVRQMEQR